MAYAGTHSVNNSNRAEAELSLMMMIKLLAIHILNARESDLQAGQERIRWV